MSREKIDCDYIGPVIVTEGRYLGRIGYCDGYGNTKYFQTNSGEEVNCLELTDFETDQIHDGKSKKFFLRTEGVIYFGHMMMAFNTDTCILFDFLEVPTLKDLFDRYSFLSEQVSGTRLMREDFDPYEIIELMYERDYVSDLLNEAIREGREQKVEAGKKVFISHSKKDGYFAKMLNDELVRRGHSPWLDDNVIKVGDSIPNEIACGVRESDFVVVVLTENAVSSKWVEVEWTSKYWEEVSKSSVKVLPVLLEDCEIPTLLKMKKYADFSDSYNEGLFDLLKAIES
jgi:hypothetical protein